jgi:nitroreductase
MDIITAIETRRSIRRFKFRSIPKDDLYYFIELALCAPSAGNLQDYQFIICTNKDTISQLPSLCMDQDWIETAPAVIVVCSRPEIQKQWYGPGGELFALGGACAAIENILLSAHAFGYGACWVGAFDKDRINHLFDIPQAVRVEALIPLGYPDEDPSPVVKKELKSSLFFDKYGVDLQDFEKVSGEVALLRERKLRHFKKQVNPKISSMVSSLKDKLSLKKDTNKEEKLN